MPELHGHLPRALVDCAGAYSAACALASRDRGTMCGSPCCLRMRHDKKPPPDHLPVFGVVALVILALSMAVFVVLGM
jgi:hypothetical protein